MAKFLYKIIDESAHIVYRLFFTKDDDMDLTQFYFGAMVLWFIYSFAMAGSGEWKVSVAAWSVFGGVFATLAIAGTSHVVSKRLADSKVAAEMAAAISKSPYEPNMYKDDERGEFKDREDV